MGVPAALPAGATAGDQHADERRCPRAAGGWRRSADLDGRCAVRVHARRAARVPVGTDRRVRISGGDTASGYPPTTTTWTAPWRQRSTTCAGPSVRAPNWCTACVSSVLRTSTRTMPPSATHATTGRPADSVGACIRAPRAATTRSRTWPVGWACIGNSARHPRHTPWPDWAFVRPRRRNSIGCRAGRRWRISTASRCSRSRSAGAAPPDTLEADIAGYAERTEHLIFRDANGFNVSDGETESTGVEFTLRNRIGDCHVVELTGTYRAAPLCVRPRRGARRDDSGRQRRGYGAALARQRPLACAVREIPVRVRGRICRVALHQRGEHPALRWPRGVPLAGQLPVVRSGHAVSAASSTWRTNGTRTGRTSRSAVSGTFRRCRGSSISGQNSRSDHVLRRHPFGARAWVRCWPALGRRAFPLTRSSRGANP